MGATCEATAVRARISGACVVHVDARLRQFAGSLQHADTFWFCSCAIFVTWVQRPVEWLL